MSGYEAIPAARLAAARDRVVLSQLIGRSVKLKKRGGDHIGLCPFHNERTPSFNVIDAKQFYHCFGCGAHGDAIAWLMQKNGLSFPAAVAALDGGVVPEPAETERLERERSARQIEDERRRLSYRELARLLWAESVPIGGTSGERYFRGRGITCALPPTLRYHPRVVLGSKADRIVLPAVVAAVQDPASKIAGVHRIFLDPASIGDLQPQKAVIETSKALLGSARTGAVRLGPAAARMTTGEGIETCLSVMQADPSRSVWSGIDANHMALILWPDVVRDLLIYADRDRISVKPGHMQGRRPGEYWARVTAARFVAGKSVLAADGSPGSVRDAELRRALIAIPPGDKADGNDRLLD